MSILHDILHKLDLFLSLLFVIINLGLSSDSFRREFSLNNVNFSKVTKDLGSNITINCFNSKFATPHNNSLWSSQQVTWMWKPQNELEWRKLSEKQNRIVFLENSKNSGFILSNLSTSDSGFYACSFAEAKQAIKTVELVVNFLPTFHKCEVNGFLTSISCFWFKNGFSPPGTTYLLYHNTAITMTSSYQKMLNLGKTKRNYSTTVCSKEKVSGEKEEIVVQCSVGLSLSKYGLDLPTFYMKLQVSDAFASLNSSELPETILNHVRTDPPTNLKVSDVAESGDGMSSIIATWNAPKTIKGLKLLYLFRHRFAKAEQMWQEDLVENQNHFVLRNLHSFASYEFQVAASPRKLNSFFIYGQWSEWSPMVKHHTPQKVPLGWFVFFNVNATKVEANSSKWLISANWSPYKRNKEPGVYYEISYLTVGEKSRTKMKFERNKGSFIVHGSNSITLFGNFCNPINCSEHGDSVFVNLNNAIDKLSVTNVNLTYSLHTKTVMSWKITEYEDVDTPMCIARLCSIYRKETTFDNLYNAQRSLVNSDLKQTNGNSFSCQELVVTCSSRKATFNIDVSPCFTYQATVLLYSQDKNVNVMIASETASLTLENSIVPKYLPFQVNDASSNNEFQISVKLSEPFTVDLGVRNDLRLSAVFSPKSGAECPTNCTRTNAFHESFRNASDTQLDVMINRNVYGHTVYDVGLGYCCGFYQKTSQGMCFAASSNIKTVRTSPGAPSAPSQISFEVEKDEVAVYWERPKHPNGVITGYELQYGRLVENFKENRSDEKLIRKLSVFGNAQSLFIPLHCNSENNDRLFYFRLAAFTNVNSSVTFGDSIYSENKVCHLQKTYSNLRSIIIGSSVCLVIFILIWIFAMYYRKHIKRCLRKHVWPEVPFPDVYVHFTPTRETDECATLNGENRSNGRALSVTNYLNNSTSQEFPDSITDEITVKIMEKQKEKFNLRKKEQDSSSNEPTTSSNSSNSTVQWPKMSLPNTNRHRSPSTSAWRRIFYPSLSNQTSASYSRLRPHSFTEASLNSFNRVSYLQYRQCEESPHHSAEPNSATQNIDENSSSVVYNKLIINSNGEPKFFRVSPDDEYTLFPVEIYDDSVSDAANDMGDYAASVGENFLRSVKSNLRRGESWYDRNSELIFTLPDSTHDHFLTSGSSQPLNPAEAPTSYVLAPSSAEDFSSDENGQSVKQLPDTSFLLKNQGVTKTIPSTEEHLKLFETENSSANCNLENDVVNEDQSVSSSLDQNMTSYVQEESESYVTMNEALQPSWDEGDCSYLKEPNKIEENSLMIPLSSGSSSNNSNSMTNLLSRLLNRDNESDNRSLPDYYDDEDNPDENNYVTEAETSDLLSTRQFDGTD